MSDRAGAPAVDLLVVGAGPTGLALAAQAHAAGARVEVVERRLEPSPESRAVAIHARTLEVLRPLGVAGRLVERGAASAELQVHARGRTARGHLSGFAMPDTRYGFLLLLPQADTEAVLEQQLASRGVRLRRGIELVDFSQEPGGVTGVLRPAGGGRVKRLRARFIAGCDGAASTVRTRAGIRFPGGPYRRGVLLADLEVDGDLATGALHAFLDRRGILFFFPLARDATWRLLAIVPRPAARSGAQQVPLGELQRMADRFAPGHLRLRAPVRARGIRLEHRLAERYRHGRAFLAGDAAHLHSPAGAQGMNTGIQDACNLGWKLALVARGAAHAGLLGTYEPERRPTARLIRCLTDVAFAVEGSGNALVGLAREWLAPPLVPLVLRHDLAMRTAVRAVSGVHLRYRASPLSVEGRPRLRAGVRAGDRLPDVEVRSSGSPARLHDVLAQGSLHVLLCGPSWRERDAERVRGVARGSVAVHRLVASPEDGTLHDHTGAALARLGVAGDAAYLVRPDGYVGFRSRGTGLAVLDAYLARWLEPGVGHAPAPGDEGRAAQAGSTT